MATPPPPPPPDFDLVVVGLGPAGRAAVTFAAGLGLQVAAVEQSRPGGNSLWSGAVPSTAIIASARAAHNMRTADRLGIHAVEPQIDLATVWRRARAVQADIARTDHDPRSIRDLGIVLLQGTARLTSPNEVEVTTPDGSTRSVSTRFVLLCTGSRPHVPAIDGLADGPFLTSNNLFAIDAPPASLAIIGGGAMGTEMAQALNRLGVQVVVFERLPTLLASEEPGLVERLTEVLVDEGVRVHCSADVRRIEHHEDGSCTVHATVGNDALEVHEHVGGVLIAAGRDVDFDVDALGATPIGIGTTRRGVVIDDRGRTAVRTVYAAGDIVGMRRVSNGAAFDAIQAVRDMFFPGKGDTARTIPSCVFTDPELARIGLTVAEAEDLYGADTDVWLAELAANDRARTEARTEGAVMVVTVKDKVVGAHVLAPAAGEIVHELALAVREGVRIDQLAGLVHAYPTFAATVGSLATEAAFERAHRLKWMVRRK